MTRDELYKAFVAWQLAIQDKILRDAPQISFLDRARAFGRDITNEIDLQAVSDFFDFDKIIATIKQCEEETTA